jgi:hypothetical protein
MEKDPEVILVGFDVTEFDSKGEGEAVDEDVL